MSRSRRVAYSIALAPHCLIAMALVALSCSQGRSLHLESGETFAELRAIKGNVTVKNATLGTRPPLSRERLGDAEIVTAEAGALAFIRRDAGATWLVKGPARLTIHTNSIELSEGRAFIDTESGPPVVINTPKGPVELSQARASIEVEEKGTISVYVLRGSARVPSAGRAGPGEFVILNLDGTSSRKPALAWDDWTGGLATADAAAQPAPFGLGTIGARLPGDKGKPRFSLVIQRLDVNVTIDHDLAITEVDESFVNPSSDTVEGLFSFRTPEAAVLQRFGVDRSGQLVWGRIQESASAVKQYETNVYAGSSEDPALLQWAGAGIYAARLYPIASGSTRRVVTRYSEWLPRQGPNGERRLYVYPMAAEGAIGTLPRIEELTVNFDLSRSGAKTVRTGMGGKYEDHRVVVKAFDFVPRADLALELFDEGERDLVAYRTTHALSAEEPEREVTDFAKQVSRKEADYLLLPLRTTQAASPPSPGLDLAIVVDTSAATEPGALAIARSMAAALLAHLGPADRAALWTGDASLRPVTDTSGSLCTVDPVKRRQWLAALSSVERGGATDLGALLAEAASRLDSKRSNAVLYIGDGQPTVGEVAPKALRERLARLPQSTRVLVAALGSNANLPLLDKLSRGAPVEPIGDAYGAARAALRLLEAAGRPLWLGASVDIGTAVERVLPRELPPVGPEQTALVVGRIKGNSPAELTLRNGTLAVTRRLRVVELQDYGDLRRRWGGARLSELLDEGAGRSALVELGLRYGLVSPFTSIYVPTKRETEKAVEEVKKPTPEELAQRKRRWKPWLRTLDEDAPAESTASAVADKEGGTGTRAKGEEGSMGNPTSKATNKRYAVQGPRDSLDPHTARAAALRDAQEFGMIGLLNTGGAADPKAPEPSPEAPAKPVAAVPAATATAGDVPTSAVDKISASATSKRYAVGSPESPTDNRPSNKSGKADCLPGDPLCESSAEMMGLSGLGDELAAQGAIGHGFGSGGHGRLSGSSRSNASRVIKQGALTVNGRLPPEVIARITRQNYARFRLCYEQGLERNPNLTGQVVVSFLIGHDGAVTNVKNSGSTIPDSGVVQCVIEAHHGLSFPQPEGGIVRVVHPMTLSLGPSAPSQQNTYPAKQEPNANAAPPVNSPLGVVGHEPRPCGPGSDLPLSERRLLWAERLSQVRNAYGALSIYRQALADCEAPGWRERQYLLITMVDHLNGVNDRVALWRLLLGDPAAADVVFRSLLVRVSTSEQLRELHDALGLAHMDPTLLAKLVSRSKSAPERLKVLRQAALRWKDDLELALLVLDAYEDANDVAGGRAWARGLRRRADASAHVHTNVGEYYLRLSERETGVERDRDLDEARRAFGELVEFAPDDPAARRRLGDLLRAHGWFEEAFRQYETLAQLTPDDPTVPLLLAAAANGMGKVEQALGWLNKAASVGSPGGNGELSRASRALASVFVALAFDDAKRANRADEAERLLTRARTFASDKASSNGTMRVFLTWSHPELRASLWSSSVGVLAPSNDNFPLFGVAEAKPTNDTKLEIRLDHEDAERAARLHAEATLTAITNEGLPEQKVAHLNLKFGTPSQPQDRLSFNVENGEIRQEAP